MQDQDHVTSLHALCRARGCSDRPPCLTAPALGAAPPRAARAATRLAAAAATAAGLLAVVAATLF